MRRLITILMVVAFGVMTLSTPVLAWGPDDPRYDGGSDRYEETDDGGWGDMNYSTPLSLESGTNPPACITTSRTSFDAWIGSLLFHFGGYTAQIEKPSNMNVKNDCTSSRGFRKSSRATRR